MWPEMSNKSNPVSLLPHLVFDMSLGPVLIGFTSIYFTYIFNVKWGGLLLSVHTDILVSWPESWVETSCHPINLFANCLLVVIENFDRCYN